MKNKNCAVNLISCLLKNESKNKWCSFFFNLKFPTRNRKYHFLDHTSSSTVYVICMILQVESRGGMDGTINRSSVQWTVELGRTLSFVSVTSVRLVFFICSAPENVRARKKNEIEIKSYFNLKSFWCYTPRTWTLFFWKFQHRQIFEIGTKIGNELFKKI